MTSATLEKLKEWYQKNSKEILEDFFTFLRFKSIGTDPEYKEEVDACANWVNDYCKKIGLKSEIKKTPVHPLVLAEKIEDKKKPTLLFYGHYDVQPVDPIEEWLSDPFKPEVRDGEVYARGTLDDKGQIFYSLVAIRALLELEGNLPVNVKLCIEGEEEAASTGLSKILPDIKDQIKADFLIVPDCGLPDRNTPAITLGARGIVALEIELIGSNIDLHSGEHGGIAFNPNRELVSLLSKLWDENGRVTIPNFYDEVDEVPDRRKVKLSMDFNEKEYSKTFGINAFGGEQDRKILERNWLRPTLEINGIAGGYYGAGFKTVIPAKAIAKISCRLVPHQEPEKIGKLVAQFLRSQVRSGIELNVKVLGGGMAVRAGSETKIALATSAAYSEIFGKPCQKIMSGGSIPIVADLVQKLGSDVVLMGLGLSDDHMHAPNEHFGLDRFEKGFLIIARTIEILGKD